MGLASRIILFLGFFTCLAGISQATAEDVENFKDPYVIEIASYAANSLLKAANDLGINNKSSLNRIMDAQVVPNTQPTVIIYCHMFLHFILNYYHYLTFLFAFSIAHTVHAYT